MVPVDVTQATSDLLALFAGKTTRQAYLDAVVEHLAAWTGCRCVGIRLLNPHSEIPYESYIGFSREFWLSESRLSVVHDTCACIRVVQGQPWPQDLPVMTAGGSFCCLDVPRFVAGLTPAELTAYRGACVRAGFESVSIVPLQRADQKIGAIHLADERPDTPPAATVALIEAIGPLIGEAVRRFDLEEDLRRNHDTQRVVNQVLRLALETVPLEQVLAQALDLMLGIPWLAFEARGCIFLVEEGKLALKAARDLEPAIREACTLVPFGRCLCGLAAATQEIQFAEHLDARHVTQCQGMTPHGHYCVPIVSAGALLGVITIYLTDGHQRYAAEEAFLTTVANALAGVIERARTTEAVRVGEERYRSVVAAMSEGIVVQDAGGKILACNASAEHILGLTADQMQGRTSLDPRWRAIHEDGTPFPGEAHPAMVTLRTGQSCSAVIMGVYRADGSLVWVSVNSQSLLHPGAATPHAVVATFADITEHRRAELALRENEERFRVALKGSPIIVWNQDRDLRYTWIHNPAWDYAAEQMVGKTDDDLASPEGAVRLTKIKRRVLETGMGCREEVALSNQGQVYYYDLTVEPLRDAAGAVVGVTCATMDISERKRAEAAQRESEARYQGLFESAREAVLASSPDGKIIEANPAAARLFGYDEPGQMVGLPAVSFYADVQQRREVYELLKAQGYAENLELTLARRDGAPMYVLGSATLRRDAQGRIVRTEGVFLDITERKRAEEQLRFQAHLLDAVGQAIIATDLAGTIIYWNQGAVQLYGWAAGEAIGRDVVDVTPASTSQAQAAEIMARLAAGESWSGEFAVQRRDGTAFPALVTDTPVYDAAGKLIGVIGVSTDISDLKQMQQAEHAQRLLAEALLDSAELLGSTLELDALLDQILEHVGRVADSDLAAITLFRDGAGAIERVRGQVNLARVRSHVGAPIVARGKIIGSLSLDSLMPEYYTTTHADHLRAFANQAGLAIENARLYEQVRRHAAELEQRVAERTAELRDANEKLKELDQFKSQFVSNVSHELRTPLANVKLLLGLLERGKLEKRDYYRTTALREADLLAALIEDLLYLSRMDLGKVQPQLAPLDVSELVVELAADRTELLTSRGLALRTDLAADLPPVLADRRMITQVVTNLMANAMNYTPAGGTITVSTRLPIADCGLPIADLPAATPETVKNAVPNLQSQISNLQWVTLSISDTGPGISAEEQAQLFERFFRGEAGRRGGVAGTGLGLAICQELVQRHGGKITLASELGHGSTFTVWLPAAQAADHA
ncbi:MAG: PAS domain S-box protein [Chloroflexi bacterium]|nr:PAS domain S-box protein [Chloroflexota bacterium]